MAETVVMTKAFDKDWEIEGVIPDLSTPTDEFHNHQVNLQKIKKYDEEGLPTSKVINFNFKNSDFTKTYRITEIITYLPIGWVSKTPGEDPDFKLNAFYETWIEEIDDATQVSRVFKLENGVMCANEMVEEQVKKIIYKEEVPEDPYGLEF